jgi:hypothetical protein
VVKKTKKKPLAYSNWNSIAGIGLGDGECVGVRRQGHAQGDHPLPPSVKYGCANTNFQDGV